MDRNKKEDEKKSELLKTSQYKKALISALETSLGVVTTACRKVGVSRRTYYDYYNSDEDFKREVDEMKEVALDFVESKLFESIEGVVIGKDQDGETNVYKTPPNVTAIIFHLKTKGKDRGYTEKQEIEIESTENKVIEVKVLETNFVEPQPKEE